MDLFSFLQWPAMVITVGAAWLVASTHKRKRHWGFWLYLASNALWVAWGLYARAYALVALQFCLAAMNIRGTRKTGTQDMADGRQNGTPQG
jgi:hypothetical protein